MLRCSHTQLMQLDQLYNFANAAGIDIEPILNFIKDSYSLPPKSKTETSAILKSIKDYLISMF